MQCSQRPRAQPGIKIFEPNSIDVNRVQHQVHTSTSKGKGKEPVTSIERRFTRQSKAVGVGLYHDAQTRKVTWNVS